MTIFEDIEKWIRLLSPTSENIPSLLEITPDTYTVLKAEWEVHPLSKVYQPIPPISKLDAIAMIVVEDLEAAWILYDQYGEEMKRSE